MLSSSILESRLKVFCMQMQSKDVVQSNAPIVNNSSVQIVNNIYSPHEPRKPFQPNIQINKSSDLWESSHNSDNFKSYIDEQFLSEFLQNIEDFDDSVVLDSIYNVANNMININVYEYNSKQYLLYIDFMKLKKLFDLFTSYRPITMDLYNIYTNAARVLGSYDNTLMGNKLYQKEVTQIAIDSVIHDALPYKLFTKILKFSFKKSYDNFINKHITIRTVHLQHVNGVKKYKSKTCPLPICHTFTFPNYGGNSFHSLQGHAGVGPSERKRKYSELQQGLQKNEYQNSGGFVKMTKSFKIN